ncbi:PEGA domain-containing protein [Natronospora cellulosivora (SeqCode)]
MQLIITGRGNLIVHILDDNDNPIEGEIEILGKDLLKTGSIAEWEDLEQGTYSIRVRKKDYNSQTQSITVFSDRTTEIYINLITDYGYIEGKLKSKLGNPIWNAEISHYGYSTITDKDGYYKLKVEIHEI